MNDLLCEILRNLPRGWRASLGLARSAVSSIGVFDVAILDVLDCDGCACRGGALPFD